MVGRSRCWARCSGEFDFNFYKSALRRLRDKIKRTALQGIRRIFEVHRERTRRAFLGDDGAWGDDIFLWEPEFG